MATQVSEAKDYKVLSQGKAPSRPRVRKGPQSQGAFGKPDSKIITERGK